MKRRDFLLTVCTVAAATTAGTAAARAAGKRIEAPLAHGFHATLKAKPGMGDALVGLLFEAPAFENNNCLIFLIGRSKSDRDLVFLTEGWTSEAAHRQFTETETAKAYIARFGPLVDGEFDLSRRGSGRRQGSARLGRPLRRMLELKNHQRPMVPGGSLNLTLAMRAMSERGECQIRATSCRPSPFPALP